MLTLTIPLFLQTRRVWIALLEKEIPFELCPLIWMGISFIRVPDTNPFHHVPVLVDDGFTLVESLAILDYSAKHPTPELLPTNARDLATVRMVEMVTVNELIRPRSG